MRHILYGIVGLTAVVTSQVATAAEASAPSIVETTAPAAPKKSEAGAGVVTAGFVTIPGTKTQLKLAGAAQLNFNYDIGPANDNILSYNEIALRADPAYANEGHFGGHGRESRLGLVTSTPFDYATLKTLIEIDFYENPAGNAVKEQGLNSFAPRVRHAFGEVAFAKSKLLFGQTWSTFMEVGALSERLDQGSPGGSHFIRQAQLRYTLDVTDSNQLSLAVENPQSAAIGVSRPDWKNRFPDLVAKWKYGGSWGFASLQGVVRDIAVDDSAGLKDAVVGVGVGLDARLKTFGKDSVTLQLAGGPGIGRYLKELEGSDATWNGTSLKATMAYGGVASYQHYWADRWRSNLIYSYAFVDNESFVTDENKELQAAFANTIYAPVKNLEIGLQYCWAKREIESGQYGVAQRVSSSFKITF